MAGLPHHRSPSGRRDGVGERLRALHVENHRLAVAGPRQNVTRVQDEQVVAPDDRAVLVDDADAIGVAVEADAEIRPLAPHCRDEILEILDDRRIGMMVGEGAVALGEEHRGGDPQSREELGSHEGTRAIATVDDGLQRARQRADARHHIITVAIDDRLAAQRAVTDREVRSLDQLQESLDPVPVQ